MITVPQATEKIIRRSRYLTEAMAKDLINASSLARYIHAEVEAIVMKPVTRGSIIMAIKRFAKNSRLSSPTKPFFAEAPDMIVRSNLTFFTLKNSPTLLSKLSSLESSSKEVQKKILFTYGRVETIILANKLLSESIPLLLKDEVIVKAFSDVSAITIHLPAQAIETPGILNLFVKSLAWEHLSLLGVLLTQTELTFVFSKKRYSYCFRHFSIII